MNKKAMKKILFVHGTVILMGGLPLGELGASGFQLLEQNGSNLGNAYAGSAAVTENASTIYFNPAGMTQLQGREVSLGLSLITPSYKFSDFSSSNSPAAQGSQGGDAGALGALPNAYLAWALNKDLYWGVGIGAPFGLKTEYEDDWVGRFQSILFDVKTYNVNPALAWRMDDRVSIGAGLNWQKMSVQYERMAATASPALPTSVWPLLQNTKLALDVHDQGAWGWNIGALFRLNSSSKLGLSYRSKVKHNLEGSLNSTDQTISPNVRAKVNVALPDTFILSFTHSLSPSWEILGDISWTGWSSLQTLDVWRTSGAPAGMTTPAQQLEVHFKDSWRFALGATQTVNAQWKMKYGIALDQSPVKGADSRLVSLPDHDRTWVTIGSQYKLFEHSVVDVGLAYLFVKDSTINNNQSALGRGHVIGDYKSHATVLGIQYSQAF